MVIFRNATAGVIGYIYQTDTSVSYQSTSDRRLKTNIADMPPMLDKIMELKPCQYNWKTNLDKLDYGLIAQDVFDVFPHMNPGVVMDTYGVEYGKFTPFIIKAIQEIKTEYDAKLSTLEARIVALEGN